MIWETLIESAKRAPSPHNVQPWLIRVTDENSADLFIVGSRTLPKEDLTGSFLLSAMMIFVATLTEVARAHGFALCHRLDQIPDPNTGQDRIAFGTLHLKPLESKDEDLRYPLELIAKRKTSRLPSWKKPVPTLAQEALTSFCADHGQTLCILSDPSEIEFVIETNISALFEDLNTPDYHDELVEWLRITDKEANNSADGLDRRCMRLPLLPMGIMMKAPKLFKAPLLKEVFRRFYRQQLGHVEHIALISGPFWTPEAALESGSFLGRFWLELARHDLQIHPFGNLVTNRPANEALSHRLGLESPWFIFRMGYTDEAPASKRLLNHKIIEYEITT